MSNDRYAKKALILKAKKRMTTAQRMAQHIEKDFFLINMDWNTVEN